MKILHFTNFRISLYIAVVLFSVLYMIVLHSSLKGGFIAGADWNNPATKQQYDKALEIFTNAWSDSWYLGIRNSSHTNLWYTLFTIVLSHIVSDLTLIPIIIIVLIQALALLTTYHFLNDLGVSDISATAGGMFLATSPIFFNYLLMGWIYVLMVFSLLNLSLIFIRKGLVNKKMSYILLAGVFFGMSFIQSQAILWIPLIATAYILFGDFGIVNLRRKAVAGVLFLLTGIVLNAPTVLDVIALPNKTLFNNEILKSSVSIGTSVKATPVNLIRLLGSGYNSQYETSQEGAVFTFASFIVTLLIISLRLIHRKSERGTITGFFLLLFIPMSAYIVSGNRELMSRIPGAAVFRDTARFSLVSTYASAILLGVFLNRLTNTKKKVKVGMYTVIAIWVFVMTLPWINGNLFNQPVKIGPDVRLRGLEYPGDYLKIEENLNKEVKAYRVLYLPIGVLGMDDNPLFRGPYREIQDVFAMYSPLPGTLDVNDRYLGNVAGFITALTKEIRNENNPNLYPYLISSSTKFLVLRTTVKFPNRDVVIKYFDGLVSENKASLYYEGQDIRAYEIFSPYPLIYSPNKVLALGTKNIDMSLFEDVETKLAFIDTTTTKVTTKQVNTKFTKISASKYKLEITNAGDVTPIVFTDNYDTYWQLTKMEKTLLEALVPTSLKKYYNHFIVNNYANGWLINTKRLCADEALCTKSRDGYYSLNLAVEYLPQRMVNIGMLVASVALLSVVLINLKGTRVRHLT